jgi:DNA-directed RNA polymerase specialized sigma24 family protein
MLGVTITAVKVRQHRARQALTAQIERQPEAVNVRADAA